MLRLNHKLQQKRHTLTSCAWSTPVFRLLDSTTLFPGSSEPSGICGLGATKSCSGVVNCSSIDADKSGRERFGSFTGTSFSPRTNDNKIVQDHKHADVTKISCKHTLNVYRTFTTATAL